MFNIYSPNMLKTYTNCHEKYYLQYIEKLNVPKLSTPFEKGKKIHALANYYLNGIDISKLSLTLNKDELQSWNKLLNNQYFNKNYVKSEFQINAKIGKYWIGGRIDAIVKEGKKYYILDYKTGSAPQNPQDEFQTMIYLLCIDKYLKGDYDSLSFIYIDLKNNKNIQIELNANLAQRFEEKLISVISQIESDAVYKRNVEKCKSCEFSKICNV